MLRVPQHERNNVNSINYPPFVLSAVEDPRAFQHFCKGRSCMTDHSVNTGIDVFRHGNQDVDIDIGKEKRNMPSNDSLERSILPIPDRKPVTLTTYTAKDPDTKFPAITPLRPPTGAPNVLVILIDDAGFGSSSAFGGPCNTPTAERLAAGGLKYNRFHTTALCSPTRAAMLSGRNHHAVGMGGITEIATSAPGYNSLRPNTCAPLAEILRLNGYSTAQFGKCHEVPVFEATPVGPYDHWPHPGGGFERFYGFIGGENNQYYPSLYDGTTPIEPERTPEEGYHLTEDLPASPND